MTILNASSPSMLLIGLLAVFALPAPVQAGRADPKQQIASLEQDYSEGFVTGDTKVAQRLLSEDFIGFSPSGATWDKARILTEVKSDLRPVSCEITALTVDLHGDTAIALGTEEDTKASAPLISHRRWLDTWRRTSKGWRLVASAEVEPKP